MVRNLAGRVLAELRLVAPGVPALQAAIEERCGVLPALQRLIQRDHVLGDGEELSDGEPGMPLEVVLLQEPRPAAPSDLRFQQRLASGGFGELWACEWVASGEAFCVKQVRLQLFNSCLQEADVEGVIRRLQCAKHPHIAQYCFHFRDEAHLYIGMERPSGGTLAELLAREQRLECEVAAQCCHDLCCALDFMHCGAAEKMLHWDLHPETVCLDDGGRFKLRDLGWSSAVLHPFLSLKDFSGAVEYLGPETILGSAHCERLDMWQLGVLLYQTLTGTPAFQEPDVAATCRRILRLDLRFPPQLDPDACELIAGLCRREPAERLEAAQARRHRFVTRHL